jgi:hypothetical protein
VINITQLQYLLSGVQVSFRSLDTRHKMICGCREAGDASKARNYFPQDKQYLVTRGGKQLQQRIVLAAGALTQLRACCMCVRKSRCKPAELSVGSHRCLTVAAACTHHRSLSAGKGRWLWRGGSRGCRVKADGMRRCHHHTPG